MAGLLECPAVQRVRGALKDQLLLPGWVYAERRGNDAFMGLLHGMADGIGPTVSCASSG